MAFDFIQGVDCDPLELDRRLKQAEDNPPGPVPPPGPTPGVDFDYSTTPVLTTALPHWGLDFEDVEENSIVIKDNAVFMNLGIAYTKKFKLFVRVWSPRSAYGNRGGGIFSGVAMLYLGDDSCDFSNDGVLPTIGSTVATGSITVSGYTDFVSACDAANKFKSISITNWINTGNPLQNAKTSLARYKLEGTFSSSGLLSFTITGAMYKNGGSYSSNSDTWTKLDEFQTQKTVEFCDGMFALIGHNNTFQTGANTTGQLIIPCGYFDEKIFNFSSSVTDYKLLPLEPIFNKDKELHQQDPTTWHPEGVGVPLNNFTKYNVYARYSLHPRARVAAGESFKPGYMEENMPAEWNAM